MGGADSYECTYGIVQRWIGALRSAICNIAYWSGIR